MKKLAILVLAIAALAASSRISTTGQITSLQREGGRVRITLDRERLVYYVRTSDVRDQNVHIGDRVRISGRMVGDAVEAESISVSGGGSNYGDQYGNRNRDREGYGNGWVRATVISHNRRLNYITVRDDGTGRVFKIDVRQMDTRRSVNVWQTHSGDRLKISGSWENRDTFRADRVQY